MTTKNVLFVRIAAMAATAMALLPATLTAAESPKPYPVTIPVNVHEDKDENDKPPLKLDNIKLSFGGRVKLDAMLTHVSDGDIPTPSFARDQYQAIGIPVAAGGGESHQFFDYNAKGTILWFKAAADYGQHQVATHLEFDFRVNPGAGNEIATNAYNPGLRHAYLTYDDWLFGQTFSLFRNIDAAPDTIESGGGAIESLVIVRQPQIRYSFDQWQFSLENNEASLTANGGASTRNVTGDARFPDLIARYNFATRFGEFSAAALLGELAADNTAMAPVSAKGRAVRSGLMLSGKIPVFGSDDVRFNVMAGQGIGRYATAATIDDAVVKSDGSLETINVVTGYGVYRHVWNSRWRSNFLVSAMLADNDTAATGLGVTRSVTSTNINTLYSPVDKLTFGVQLIYAIREIEQPRAGGDSGEYGTLARGQFTVMYLF